MKDFLNLMNPARWAWLGAVAVVLLALAMFGTWWVYGMGKDAGIDQQQKTIAAMELQAAKDVAAAHKANAEELSTLAKANTEIQIENTETKEKLAKFLLSRARSDGLRDGERAAITGAAQRASAGAIAGYVDIAERHIAGVEDDAVEMGGLAVRAASDARSLDQTLQSRRAALDTKRQALKPSEK